MQDDMNAAPSPQEAVREKIARYLPDAIEKAIQSYRQFYGTPEIQDAKSFSAHHSACRAAIGHIELLLKLANWAHLPRPDTDDAVLANIIKQAQGTLDSYQEEDDE